MSTPNDDTVQALLQKAREALSDADLLVENGSAEAAINRAYYAVFSTARAALLLKDVSPSTHAGLVRRFGYHFVRTEAISEEIGGILSTAQSMREEADYEIFSDFELEEAAALARDARRFVEVIDEKLRS
jgi:uncharacterized protein (UPF0332 family)